MHFINDKIIYATKRLAKRDGFDNWLVPILRIKISATTLRVCHCWQVIAMGREMWPSNTLDYQLLYQPHVHLCDRVVRYVCNRLHDKTDVEECVLESGANGGGAIPISPSILQKQPVGFAIIDPRSLKTCQ